MKTKQWFSLLACLVLSLTLSLSAYAMGKKPVHSDLPEAKDKDYSKREAPDAREIQLAVGEIPSGDEEAHTE